MNGLLKTGIAELIHPGKTHKCKGMEGSDRMAGTRQIVVGLIGQVCAGKSAVAGAFARNGAWIYDADKIVHEIYTRPEVIKQVSAMFGKDVLNQKGDVDRKALAKIVFSDRDKLLRLTEEVIFPRTGEALDELLSQFRNSAAPALVLDAPTLIEAGREEVCDFIVFVSAPLSRRQAWAHARGWPEGELELRDARLNNEQSKREKADVVIENSGSLGEIEQKAGELLKQWRSLK